MSIKIIAMASLLGLIGIGCSSTPKNTLDIVYSDGSRFILSRERYNDYALEKDKNAIVLTSKNGDSFRQEFPNAKALQAARYWFQNEDMHTTVVITNECIIKEDIVK